MSEIIELVLVLLGCAIVLGAVSRRIGLPYPILLVIGGLGLGFVPGLPQLKLNPEVVFLVFLPPILYQAALFTSWRDFRANLRPIMLLAVGLVVLTTVAVAVVAKLLVPGLPFWAAVMLGAIVSPPDAIAATAVFRRIKVPRRMVTILEGESLVNDAAALVLYRLSLIALIAGDFYIGKGAIDFLMVASGGIAIGLALGWLFTRVHRLLGDPLIELMLSIILPFLAFLIAENLHLSAVLAVVAAGLIRGWYAPEAFSPLTRMQAFAVWDVIVFLLNSLVFVLIGIQLSPIINELDPHEWRFFLLVAAAVSLTVILVRFLWVFPAAHLPRLLSPALRAGGPGPSAGFLAIMAWSGMRGIVSLAAALAIPHALPDGSPFPHRELIVFVTYAVIFVTLVIQGTTLPLLIRGFRLAEDSEEAEEERLARLKTAHAAIAAIDAHVALEHVPAKVAHLVRGDYVRRLTDARVDPEIEDDGLGDMHRSLRLQAIAAQRRRLLKLRRDLQISDEVLHRIERELDLEEARFGQVR